MLQIMMQDMDSYVGFETDKNTNWSFNRIMQTIRQK